MSSVLAGYAYLDDGPSAHHSYNLRGILHFLAGQSRLTILDAGCGNGSLSTKLASLGHCVIGIDVAADGIEIAKSRGFAATFYVRSVYDDLSDILPAGGVDVVMSCEVIEHLYSPDKFLEGCSRALRHDGRLIITTPYHGWLKNFVIGLVGGWDNHFMVGHEGAHIKFFSKRTLFAMLAKHGFCDFRFRGVGRCPYLWKGMVVECRRP